MVETGDWIVPTFNGTLAVDKPVLMHWCMAACMSVFGVNEFAARLPSLIAALVTALAVLRFGTRFFDSTIGVVAALAWLGTLLVGIEAHAATPDAILVALTAWATVLAAEVIAGPVAGKEEIPRLPAAASGDDALPQLSVGRAAGIGLLLGLAQSRKGGVVGLDDDDPSSRRDGVAHHLVIRHFEADHVAEHDIARAQYPWLVSRPHVTWYPIEATH